MKILYKEKELAIKMRLSGMSYSQIKSKIKVSKSTLSIWLEKYPLSAERIKELRDWNPRRIENCRNTKLKKRQERLKIVYENVSKEIGILSKRDLFIAGMFLYWGEGTKASRGLVALTNTDPSMIKLFIKWLKLLGVNKNLLRIKLHLYIDMDINEKTAFWSRELEISIDQFTKPYIKDSRFTSLTYKNSFGHGTCIVYYSNTEFRNKIIMSLKYLSEVASVK